MEYEVREERSGWRDEKYSKWHRKLGWDVPAQDVDLMLWNEYDNFEPTALLELKNERAKMLRKDSAQARAQRNLANGYRSERCPNGLPFFVVYYQSDLSKFMVHAFNATAHEFLRCPAVPLNPEQYVLFLYKLRGHKKVKPEILQKAVEAQQEIMREMYVDDGI